MLGGAAISPSLEAAAYLAAAVLVILVAAGAAAFTSDAPLELVGRAIQRILNASVRREARSVERGIGLAATCDRVRSSKPFERRESRRLRKTS